MNRSRGSRATLKWTINSRDSVIADVIPFKEFTSMPWWKFRKEPQYKTDRGIAAIYAVLAISWFAIWYASPPMIHGGYWHALLALSWAGVSIFYIVRSIKHRSN